MNAPSPGNEWLRWFPAPVTDRTSAWKLIRFEAVDQEGKPVGKPIAALAPSNNERRFPTERIAGFAALALNDEEGR